MEDIVNPVNKKTKYLVIHVLKSVVSLTVTTFNFIFLILNEPASWLTRCKI